MVPENGFMRFGRMVLTEAVVVALGTLLVISVLKMTDRSKSTEVTSKLPSSVLSIGARLTVRGVNFQAAPLALVLVSSPTCPYCLASSAFHGKLILEARHGNIPLIVAIPNRVEAKNYLTEVGFSDSFVREWKDLSMRVEGTPTLIAVDREGVVKSIWTGVLPPYDESAVLSLIKTHTFPPTANFTLPHGIANYASSDLSKIRKIRHVHIVDTHERGFSTIRSDAIMIPALELPYRAGYELNRHDLQLVDCSNLERGPCSFSVQELQTLGFTVAALDFGHYRQTCRSTIVH